jgi:Sec-independent protein translocase protein TatA
MLSLMKPWTLLALFVLALSLAGCDNPQRTVDTLRTEIAEFKKAPDEKKQTQIDAHFAKLQQQIAQVETKNATQADLLKRQYAGLQGEYQAAKLAKTLNDARNAIQGLGEAFKEGAKSFSDSLKTSGTSE